MDDQTQRDIPQAFDLEQYNAYQNQLKEYYRLNYPDYYAYYYGAGNTSSSNAASSTSPYTPAHARSQASYSYQPGEDFSKLITSGTALGSHVGSSKAFRQMSHYFDYDTYNDEMNKQRLLGQPSATKFSKSELETLKKRKKDLKKKKMLNWLKKD